MALRRLRRLGYAVLIVAFSHTSLQAHPQSLVDAARLARDIRERHGPPTKVYTNDDLPDNSEVAARREPTPAGESRYRSLLEEALERERVLLELLRTRRVTRPAPVPVQTAPPPAPATPGIPLYLAYSGYPVIVAPPHPGGVPHRAGHLAGHPAAGVHLVGGRAHVHRGGRSGFGHAHLMRARKRRGVSGQSVVGRGRFGGGHAVTHAGHSRGHAGGHGDH